MSAPTAAWPASSLVRSLALAGWGDLADLPGVPRVLRGLCDALATRACDLAGAGLVTAPQIARAAAVSEKTVRRRLTELEQLGLIAWQRGGIRDGRPQPSYIRLDKQGLVALIRGARSLLVEVLRLRAERTAARLRGLRLLTVRPRSRALAGAHADTTTTPHPSRGGTGCVPPPRPLESSPERPTTMLRDPIKTSCEHGGPARRADGRPRCPFCKAEDAKDRPKAAQTVTPSAPLIRQPALDLQALIAGEN